MTILAHLLHWRHGQVALRGIARRMRRMTIHAVACVRVNALPARQQNMKVIIKPASRHDARMTLGARVVAQFDLRDRRIVIMADLVRSRIARALR